MTKEILSKDERSNYSLSNFIKSMIPGGTFQSPLEDKVAERLRGPDASVRGCRLAPWEILCPGLVQHRDLNVSTFGQGGAFVETTVAPEVIDILRNRPVVRKLGCTVLSGLSGNVALPRETGAATPQSFPEQGIANTSTQSLDQITMTPHRVTVSTQFSRQLLLQSAVDCEAFIRADLQKAINVKIDALAIAGSGAGDEPCGLLNTAGVGSVLFGGTASWSSVVSFESALAQVNVVNDGSQSWILSPLAKSRWKTIAKTGVGVTSVVPIFLIEDRPDDRGLFVCDGYNGACTNNVPGNLAILGKMSDLVLGIWGDGADVIFDPYTLGNTATIRLVMHMWIDIVFRHPQSFVVSADSASQ
jgi:hypothetical protein